MAKPRLRTGPDVEWRLRYDQLLDRYHELAMGRKPEPQPLPNWIKPAIEAAAFPEPALPSVIRAAINQRAQPGTPGYHHLEREALKRLNDDQGNAGEVAQAVLDGERPE